MQRGWRIGKRNSEMAVASFARYVSIRQQPSPIRLWVFLVGGRGSGRAGMATAAGLMAPSQGLERLTLIVPFIA